MNLDAFSKLHLCVSFVFGELRAIFSRAEKKVSICFHNVRKNAPDSVFSDMLTSFTFFRNFANIKIGLF